MEELNLKNGERVEFDNQLYKGMGKVMIPNAISEMAKLLQEKADIEKKIVKLSKTRLMEPAQMQKALIDKSNILDTVAYPYGGIVVRNYHTGTILLVTHICKIRATFSSRGEQIHFRGSAILEKIKIEDSKAVSSAKCFVDLFACLDTEKTNRTSSSLVTDFIYDFVYRYGGEDARYSFYSHAGAGNVFTNLEQLDSIGTWFHLP